MEPRNYYEEHKNDRVPPYYRPQNLYPRKDPAPAVYPGEELSRKSYKKKRPLPLRILRWFFLILLICTLAAGILGVVRVRQIIAKAPVLDPNAVAPAQAASYICRQDGTREQKLTLPEANRDLVSIDHIPEDLQHAFVAIEDSRFYTHNGIDLPGIVRAFVMGIRRGGHFSEGASTITQQLLKNSIFTGWTSEKTFMQRLERKIQEQYLALQLERLLTKNQILEDYLNTINLGAGCYGVQAAAYRYFGKDVADLTLSEDAVIAGITQNPTRYNPISNPQNNAARRENVLSYMLAQKYISQEAYDEAMADDVYARIQSNEESLDTRASIYTFYQDALIDQVMEDLMNEKGYTYKQAYRSVYTGGLRIYSAQDPSIQKICDEEFINPDNFPEGTQVGIDYALSIEKPDGEIIHYGNDNLTKFVREHADPSFSLMCDDAQTASGYAAAFREAMVTDEIKVLGERVTITPQPQASLVILDQSAGHVLALIGGRGDKDASLTLNRATYTTRQPGSTFKILTAYAPVLEEGGKTLATRYENGVYAYEDGTSVSNWDLSVTDGPTTIRDAIIRSVNVVAVECLTEMTPRKGYDYACSFGITTLVDQMTGTDGGIYTDIIQPLALGGITKGVTNLELTAAYACIANGGQYISPKFYTKVTDSRGEIILDHSEPVTRTVISEATAYELTSAMEDVISDPDGTAHKEISTGEIAMAGKTGTTSDYRDIWFVGYSPYYTCGIWCGYDNNEVLPDRDIFHDYDKILWNSVMTRIHKDLPARRFIMPGSIASMNICAETGMCAAPDCPDTYEEVFPVNNMPMFRCDKHGDGSLADPSFLMDNDLASESVTVHSPDTIIYNPGQGGTGQGNPGFDITTQDIVILNPQEPAAEDAAPPAAAPDASQEQPPAGSWSQTQNNPGQDAPGFDITTQDIVILN